VYNVGIYEKRVYAVGLIVPYALILVLKYPFKASPKEGAKLQTR
jgi:hypothetical protein